MKSNDSPSQRNTTRSLQSALVLMALVPGVRIVAEEVLRLDIAPSNSNLRISWTNAGAVLETAPAIMGAWTGVAGATSPYVTSPSNLTGFFRLRGTVPPPDTNRYLAPWYSSSVGNPVSGPGPAPEDLNSRNNGINNQDDGNGAVLLATGELTQNAVDLSIPGRGIDWRFQRTYRSGMMYDGPLGHGWDFNYNRRLVIETNGHVLLINGADRVDRFLRNPDGSYSAPTGHYLRLLRNPDGSFEERDRHGDTYSYSAPNALGIARLTRVRDRNGNQMAFQYNPGGQLTNVVDTLARSISYQYDAIGRLTNVMDFAGRAVRFAYDNDDNLLAVTSPAVTGTTNANNFPLGKRTRYSYSAGFGDPRLNHNLLSVTAPNEAATGGPARLAAQYNTNPTSTNADRLISLRLGGTNISGAAAGGNLFFSYANLGTAPSNDFALAVFQNTVTNRAGNVVQYRFNQVGGVLRTVQFPRGLRPGEPVGYTNTYAYNGDGELIGHTNGEMNSIEYTYDSSNVDRLQQGNLRQVRRLPGPRGGDHAQILNTNSYETNFNFVAVSTDARGNATFHRYDVRGNRTNTIHRISSIVEDFEYNSFGQRTAHVFPGNGTGHRRRDVMTYYSSGPQNGYAQTNVVDSGGLNLITTYEYDSVGNVVRIVDPAGNDTRYTVNVLNKVVREQSAQTLPGVRYDRLFWYDANNNLVRTDVQNRDENGVLRANSNLTTISDYDIMDHCIRSAREKGNASLANSIVSYAAIPSALKSQFITTEYQHDANDRLVRTRFGEATAGNQPNNVVQNVYDERDLLFSEIRAPGDLRQSTTRYDYDRNGNLWRVDHGVEGLPRTTTYSYDGYDRLVRSLDPMGDTRTNRYDPNNNLLSERSDGQTNDVAGSVGNVRLAETTYSYDAMDRLIVRSEKFFDPVSQQAIGDGTATTTFTYTPSSEILTSTDDNSNRTTYAYDTANRLWAITDAKTNTTTHTYDLRGNLSEKVAIERSDLPGQPDETFRTTYVYDALDRLVDMTDSGSNQIRYAYDSRNNLTIVTNGRGNLTIYSYDGLDRLITRVCLLTDTGDGTGVFVGGTTNRQSWDNSSRLRSQTDSNENVTQYVYDSLDRLIVTLQADGSASSSEYDVHHNPITITDANGTVVTTTYDLLNRPTTNNVSPAPGVVGTTSETYSYDGLSRTVEAVNQDAYMRTSYDSLSHPISQFQAFGMMYYTLYTKYDGAGNLTEIFYPLNSSRIVRTFDALNRLKISRDSQGGPGSTNAVYYYAGPRRVVRCDSGNSTRTDKTYDGTARVRSIEHSAFGSPFYSRLFGWDASSNVNGITNLFGSDSRMYQYDSLNRLVRTDDSWSPLISYGLDSAGNRTNVNQGPGAGSYYMDPSMPVPGDFQMQQYTYSPQGSRQYDANGNLIYANGRTFSYDFRNRLVQVDGGQAVYKYDCFGRRIEKSFAGDTNWVVYAGSDEIQEVNLSSQTLSSYIWGNGQLVQMIRNGQSWFYHGDHLGTPSHLTDEFGNTAVSYAFDDYGAPNTPSWSSGNPYLFRGLRYDYETGWYFDGERYLDPTIGRYISKAQSFAENPFTFAANNPLSPTQDSEPPEPPPHFECGAHAEWWRQTYGWIRRDPPAEPSGVPLPDDSRPQCGAHGQWLGQQPKPPKLLYTATMPPPPKQDPVPIEMLPLGISGGAPATNPQPAGPSVVQAPKREPCGARVKSREYSTQWHRVANKTGFAPRHGYSPGGAGMITVTWQKDTFAVFGVCTLEKGHSGNHHCVELPPPVLVKTIEKSETYFRGESQKPPED